MKCLFDRLSICRPGDVLWVADAVGQVDISRLTRALISIDPSGWQGKRVAIGELPAIEFVCTLAFLDGLAQAIVLMPNEDDQATREARLEHAGIDIVVEGDGLGFAKLLVNCDATDSDGSSQAFDTARPAAIPTDWLLPTSGTTGTPETHCPHVCYFDAKYDGPPHR